MKPSHFVQLNQSINTQAPRRYDRILVIAAAVVLLATPILLFDPAAHWANEPELLVLLRGMALIKGAMAVLAITSVAWRLGVGGLSNSARATYIISACMMALAAGMIWQLSFIIIASMLFHAGTLALLITAWRDVQSISTRQLGKDHGQRPAERHRTGQGADQRIARRTIHPAADQAVNQEIRDDNHGDNQQEEQILERERYG